MNITEKKINNDFVCCGGFSILYNCYLHLLFIRINEKFINLYLHVHCFKTINPQF